MFYTGWEFPAPTSMNVSALSAEMRHTQSSGYTGAPFVSQQLLSAAIDTTAPAHAHPPQSTTEAALPSSVAANTAVETSRTPTAVPACQEQATPTSKARSLRHPHAPRARHSNKISSHNAGCVLHFSPRQALSYKEMEQQLQRRASGVSDCFHVKSNLPIFAQTGVILMECVVGRNAAPVLSSMAAEGESRQAPSQADTKKKLTPPAFAVKHQLPALVVGVCPQQLPWYSLPGEANNSIGFYVTQRHIVKHGGEDGDEVVVPCDVGNSSNGATAGGGRINEGDVVGCLVDVIQHTLSFTVNTQIVGTIAMSPASEDGSLYFAIGLARRPQYAAHVTVHFYTGSECLSNGTEHNRGHSSGIQQRQQPCFPLARYARALAVSSVRHRGLSGDGGRADAAGTSNAEAGAGDFMSAIAAASGKATAASEALGVDDAPPRPSAAPPPAAPSEEAIRDLRISAVLRDYLCARGMARTLRALDSELDCLVPSHAKLYTQAHSEGGDGAEKALNDTAKPSDQQAIPVAKSGDRSDVPLLCRTPQIGETRAAWQSYADSMAELRRTLLTTPGSTTDTAEPLPCLTDLLLLRVLWKPSVITSFVQFLDMGYNDAPLIEESKRLDAAHHSRLTTSSFLHSVNGHNSNNTSSGSSVHHPNLAQRSTPSSSPSPYELFYRSVSPALLTLSFLTIRQDIRYLLHAHYAVEEMWRRLRGYLQRARDSCQEPKGETTAQGGQSPHADAPSIPTMDVAQREVAAFTNYFTQLMWDVSRTLPSAAGYVSHARRGQSKTALEAATSPASLHATTVEVFARLSGHGNELPYQLQSLQAKALGGSHSVNVLKSEAQQFRAFGAAHTVLLRMASETTASSAAVAQAVKCGGSPSAIFSPVEDALLFLYNSAVVPASAPSRSAQVRLLQTLCSLFTQTLSTLRQLEEFAQEAGSRCSCSDLPDTKHRCKNGRSESRQEGLQAALASIDMLETLLDTVQKHLRQLVWRRLVHALEDVNHQLAARLSLWKAATAAGAALTNVGGEVDKLKQTPQKDGNGSAKSSRSNESVDKRVAHSRADDTAGSEDAVAVTAGEVEGEHTVSNRNCSEVEDSTRAQVQNESPDVSFSSFQATLTPEDSKDKHPDDDREGGGEGKEAGAHRSDRMSYETLTDSLPSLRQLWRRVVARAALEPSQHLVTNLFAQELCASLLLAPCASWRGRKAAGKEVEGTSSTPSSSITKNVALSGDSVTVKRPLSVDEPEAEISGVGADPFTGREGCTRDVNVAAETQWFTEELYLSSVYMRRVLKHLRGR
ncbi:hypothetical protein ABL78_6625 [Leptomonas seymouri]|uniref:SPRY domain-containing protein n=1 Tax=Leptomonas seymouri TaxID=5684 RepID=A0A0N0P3N1_LEPSE|nr:hypothetical protein ABL78_6625 [Leptomonas seymouri]|eukprot:KPI84319.1 hypothetical protein ABL78_6625 [Leptomonas seymouri]